MCITETQQKKTAEAAPDKAAAASVSSEAFSKAVAQVTLPTSGECATKSLLQLLDFVLHRDIGFVM